jgi:hypothetical protein
MRIPRLPGGPDVPLADSEEGRKFTQRWIAACAGVALAVGIIYASGVAENNRELGFALIGLSVAMMYPYWLVRRRSPDRSEGSGPES